jgi:hypothetical protein
MSLFLGYLPLPAIGIIGLAQALLLKSGSGDELAAVSGIATGE